MMARRHTPPPVFPQRFALARTGCASHRRASRKPLSAAQFARPRCGIGAQPDFARTSHDGVLQTLLSLNIQLGVLHTKVAQTHNPASEELANLQKMVRQESEELRRMVTDLRPLRVESADMKELMFGFAGALPQRASSGRGPVH